ncbi:glycosyl transferase, family II [Desulfosarcina variabilis str. Montpellier]|uniref:glycosyltransferase family 2 protein n=1 Tax=Desulfosarcina variabilis TaxID=2300 RepID=UPI003AFAE188
MPDTQHQSDGPLVSIGIPTYNRADGYLRECIESAIQQTYTNIEIIISDNCSSDGTPDLVNGIDDPRIRYFRHEQNIGANNNFNYCLEQARGVYFLLLHDDDLIDEDFVEICMQAAGNQNMVGLIRTGTRLIDSKGHSIKEMPNNVNGLSTEDFFLGWFNDKTALYLCSTLFHTENLKSLGGFSSRHNLFQDVMAEVQMAANYGRIDVKDVKAGFRKHEEERTFKVKVKAWCEDSLDLLELMCRISEEQVPFIRRKGTHFFALLNFKRAMAVASPVGRFKALLTVLNQFGYEYFVLRRFVQCLRTSAIEFLRPKRLMKS